MLSGLIWRYIELSLRYTPFNVTALEQVASRCLSAQRCTEFTKIGEGIRTFQSLKIIWLNLTSGAFNKVFLLRFDNSKEALVRIPCPIVGNVERTTQSEVATMEYIREQWGSFDTLPKLPKVRTLLLPLVADLVDFWYLIGSCMERIILQPSRESLHHTGVYSRCYA